MHTMYASDLFRDQRVLVTGGGSGIGYAIAESFLRCGATVIIASRKQERIEKAREQLADLGPVHARVLDIREPEQGEELAAWIRSELGHLDVLVNNAGGQFPSAAADIARKGWDAVIRNNLNGTWYLTQIMAKTFFMPRCSGNVVNIIANVFRGFPGMAHTGAARAAVENLTQSLAVEWAPYRIRLNAIAPGIIRSTGLEQYPPKLLAGITAKIPAKRLGSTEEVAHACLFLASPLSAYTTGETLYVDGGMRLWGDVWDVPPLVEPLSDANA
jgi:citronellol/citronellal dehydrogenase